MQGAVRATIQQCRAFYKYAWFSTSVRSLFLCPPGGKYPNQAGWLAHQGLQFLESGAEEYILYPTLRWIMKEHSVGTWAVWRYMKIHDPLPSPTNGFICFHICIQDSHCEPGRLRSAGQIGSEEWPGLAGDPKGELHLLSVTIEFNMIQHDSTISLVCVFKSSLSCSFSPQNGSLGLCEFRTPPAWVSPIFEAFGRSNKWEGCERKLPKHLT